LGPGAQPSRTNFAHFFAGAPRHTGSGWGSGTVDLPPDLPKLGKTDVAAGKVQDQIKAKK